MIWTVLKLCCCASAYMQFVTNAIDQECSAVPQTCWSSVQVPAFTTPHVQLLKHQWHGCSSNWAGLVKAVVPLRDACRDS